MADVDDVTKYAIQIQDRVGGWLSIDWTDVATAAIIPERNYLLAKTHDEYPGRAVRLVMIETKHTVLAERSA